MNSNAPRPAGLSLQLRALRSGLGSIAAIARHLLPPPTRPPNSTSGSPTRILVVRLDELGDMVLFSGFFRELRRNYPHAHVTLVAKPVGAEIMGTSPHIDRVLTFDHSFHRVLRPLLVPFAAWWFARQALVEHHFDIAIQPRWDVDSNYAAWLVYFSGASMRVGYSEHTTARKSVLNRGLDRLYTEIIADTGLKHESDRATDALKSLGLEGDATTMEVWPTSRSTDKSAESLIGVDPITRPLVAMSPSGGHSALKAWPVERFAEVARDLVRADRAIVVLLGTVGEQPLAATLIEAAGVPIINLVGETSLAETAQVLDRCSVYIGNDTGLLHMAAARKIPTVSMFGSSPARFFAPRGPQHHVIWRRLECGPFPPTGDRPNPPIPGRRAERCIRCVYPRPRCMDDIATDTVLDACLAALDYAQHSEVLTPQFAGS